MRLINKSNGDQYFIDLFEEWWHFPLLGLTWFLPHKAYLVREKNSSKPNKFRFTAGMGLATGFSFILGDIIRGMGLKGVPLEYHWIGKVFAYPLSVVLIILFYKWFVNFLKERNRVNFEKYYIVHLNILSLRTIKKCAFKLITSFIFILFLSKSLELDIFGIFLTIIVSCVLIVLFTLSVGIDVPVVSIEGDKLITE